MKKKLLCLVVAVITMVFVLSGCGSQNGSSGGNEGIKDSSNSESVMEEKDIAKDKKTAQEKEFKWLTYDLTLEELRDMNDSDNFQVVDPPSDSRYVVTKLVSKGGEIPADEITEENTENIILKDSKGAEYNPCLLGMWGIGFDDTNGFSTKEMQEGFNLLYLVPNDIELTELSLEMK